MPRKEASVVLSLRVPTDLDRLIEREARRTRRSKSAVLRQALQSAFSGPAEDPLREARRQSLLASGRASEREALDFIAKVADEGGWR